MCHRTSRARYAGGVGADVRKAAVLSLLRHAADPAARTALAGAADDPDADVRAYASRVSRA